MPWARALFYASTLGGILLAVRALLLGPPPLWASVLATAAYLLLVLAGVLVLRLRMFADALVQGPPGARGVVITFDELSPSASECMLHALGRAHAKATFFVDGQAAAAHGEALRRIVAAGHTVGLAGWRNDRALALRSPRVIRRKLARAIEEVARVTDVRPTLFRPPGGRTSPSLARVADQLDLVVVGWSVSGRPRRLVDGDLVRVVADESGGRLAEVLFAVESNNLQIVPLDDWLESES